MITNVSHYRTHGGPVSYKSIDKSTSQKRSSCWMLILYVMQEAHPACILLVIGFPCLSLQAFPDGFPQVIR
ncbi:hypothetical protein FEM48_Zijuj06G0185400 [Ziziphus jujuba var. spinosa]|uniref:Uncharacterized protein n=1 Tax=Ziziphus jujuba var. spinosa TaxID=714518 RepID=A0A978VAX9_ZIZJJ|nr:hypothetical protein FEM48_Zijuj06G0185400 [Ziziphus jujuba var. spinosa]